MRAPDRLVIPGEGLVPVLGRVYVGDFEGVEPAKLCFFCRESIQHGGSWQRLTAPDQSYSLVVHTACLNAGD